MSEETIGELYDSLAPGESTVRGGVKYLRPAGARLPEELRGEQCTRCGTVDNVVWFTDSVFWSAVIRQGDFVEPALCIPCFVVATAQRGYSPTGWRFVPEFHWETTAEYDARRELRDGEK